MLRSPTSETSFDGHLEISIRPLSFLCFVIIHIFIHLRYYWPIYLGTPFHPIGQQYAFIHFGHVALSLVVVFFRRKQQVWAMQLLLTFELWILVNRYLILHAEPSSWDLPESTVIPIVVTYVTTRLPFIFVCKAFNGDLSLVALADEEACTLPNRTVPVLHGRRAQVSVNDASVTLTQK